MRKKVKSREYKVMLNTDRFQGKESVKAFWCMVMYVAEKTAGICDVITQNFEKPAAERCTWYLDTQGKDFKKAGWVLRKREQEKKGKRTIKTTLKYRSADRYISIAKDLAVHTKNSKTKFEEDLIPSFSSKYSHSTSFNTDKDDPIQNMGDAIKLFPGLIELNLPKDVELIKVNGFTAKEVVYHLGCFKAGADKVQMKCCVSLWYLFGKNDLLPLVAEFSFDYDRVRKIGFPADVCRSAEHIFLTLQKQEGWVNLGGTTKTAFAYAGF